METSKVDATQAVSRQISVGGVAAIVCAGYRSIICNRPDREGTDQSNFEKIQVPLKNVAPEPVCFPVVFRAVNDDEAAAFGKHLRNLHRPVFEYFRTGMHSARLRGQEWLAKPGNSATRCILPKAAE